MATSITLPFNERPSSVAKIDSTDGLQTVPSGEYWRIKVNTPTGHYLEINGEKVQSREAQIVAAESSASGGSGTLHTVANGYVLEGTLSARAGSGSAFVTQNSSHAGSGTSRSAIVYADTSMVHSSVFIKLCEGEVLYNYNSSGASDIGSSLVGIEYVDGPKYGEYMLDVGDTFRIYNSSGFPTTDGVVHVEKFSIP